MIYSTYMLVILNLLDVDAPEVLHLAMKNAPTTPLTLKI